MRTVDAADWRHCSTRFVLLTGKGGGGKTTLASTAAVGLADSGRRVLLVPPTPPRTSM